MSDPYLSLVTVKNQLGVDIKRNEATRKIIERVTELGLNTAQYKNNQELLLLICNLAEYLVQHKKLSKKEIVMDALSVIFSLQPAERQAYEGNIEFLHQSNMITKVSRWKLFCTGVKELFFKKK
jgi:hypothetical protein